MWAGAAGPRRTDDHDVQADGSDVVFESVDSKMNAACARRIVCTRTRTRAPTAVIVNLKITYNNEICNDSEFKTLRMSCFSKKNMQNNKNHALRIRTNTNN